MSLRHFAPRAVAQMVHIEFRCSLEICKPSFEIMVHVSSMHSTSCPCPPLLMGQVKLLS